MLLSFFENVLNKSTKKLIILVCLIETTFLLISSFIGFDLTDESLYVLFTIYSDTAEFYTFGNIIKGFLPFIDSVIELRILRLVLTLISTYVLTLGLSLYIEKENTIQVNKNLFFCFLLIGSYLSYSISPQTISYNSISSITISLIIGIMLFVKYAKLNNIKTILLQLFIGILFSILLINKYPNFFLILPAYLCVNFYLNMKNAEWKRTIKYQIVLLPGFFVGFFVITKNINIIDYGKLLIETTINLKSSHHSSSILLENFTLSLTRLIKNNYLIVIGICIIQIINKIFKNKYWIILQVASVFLFAVFNKLYLGGAEHKYKIFDTYFLLTVMLFLTINKRLTCNNMVIIAVLFIFAVSGAFGTNNFFTTQLIFYSSLIFGIIFILAILSRSELTFNLVIILTVVVAFSQTILGVAKFPYRQFEFSTSFMKIEDDKSPLNGLFVDTNLFAINNQLKKYRTTKESHIFTFSHQIGYSLLLNKIPLGLKWFDKRYQNDVVSYLENNLNDLPKMLIILEDSFKIENNLLQAFKVKNVNIEEDYSIQETIVRNQKSDKKEYLNLLKRN